MTNKIKNNLKKSLTALSDKITEEDKLNAALHLGCSYITITRYLRGEVGKPAFAKKLIAFLQESLTETAA